MRKAIAEFIGVFLFVFTGCGACASCCLKVVPGGAPIEYALGPIAFSFGLAIMVLVFCTADISGGHLNPAVSFSFLVTGKQSPVEFVVYVIAQVLGAICAGFFLMGVLPEDYHKIDSTHATVLGTQAITNITLPQAVLVEIVTTFTLVSSLRGHICLSLLERSSPRCSPSGRTPWMRSRLLGCWRQCPSVLQSSSASSPVAICPAAA